MSDWEQDAFQNRPLRNSVMVSGVVIQRGDRVRLRPRRRADVFDVVLEGKVAQVESIEEDYEGAVYVAVVLEDDPGKDLGLLQQAGHRFFFTPEELEPLRTRILIAGIGNVFLGDDGFGSEAARRLMQQPWPPEVQVIDFGVRAIDLAYALSDGYETVILLDATPQGGDPGAVYVIEPLLDEAPAHEANTSWDPHRLDTLELLRRVKAECTSFPRILLVGCEPADLGGEIGRLGLSPPAQAALELAVHKVETLVAGILRGEQPTPIG
jgi:hydrogenase maturation protease